MVCVCLFFVLVVVLAHTLKGDKNNNNSVMDGFETNNKQATPLETTKAEAVETKTQVPDVDGLALPKTTQN